MEGRPRTRAALSESALANTVLALGVFHVLFGGWQFFANESFFEHVGRYGAENTHYVGDVGSATLAVGIALCVAAGRRTWRAPILFLAGIWYVLHAINHVFDIDENMISDFRGTLDTILLAIVAVLLLWLARVAQVIDEGVEGERPGREAEEPSR